MDSDFAIDPIASPIVSIPEVLRLGDVPKGMGEEVTTLLAYGREFRLEHIISHGAASPEGFWYDQESPEWVALVKGRATLEFEQGNVELEAGYCMTIPAHLRHRVANTSEDCVWLALHYEG